MGEIVYSFVLGEGGFDNWDYIWLLKRVEGVMGPIITVNDYYGD